jgi:hypothetical protein
MSIYEKNVKLFESEFSWDSLMATLREDVRAFMLAFPV